MCQQFCLNNQIVNYTSYNLTYNLNYKKEKHAFIVVVFNVTVFLMEKSMPGPSFLGTFLCKAHFPMRSSMPGPSF